MFSNPNCVENVFCFDLDLEQIVDLLKKVTIADCVISHFAASFLQIDTEFVQVVGFR